MNHWGVNAKYMRNPRTGNGAVNFSLPTVLIWVLTVGSVYTAATT